MIMYDNVVVVVDDDDDDAREIINISIIVNHSAPIACNLTVA